MRSAGFQPAFPGALATSAGLKPCAAATDVRAAQPRKKPVARGTRHGIFAPSVSTVAIRHIFISPGHNFFGRHGQPAGTHAAIDVRAVRVRAGLGLEGDRFCGYRPDYNGQVTFFAWETVDAARRELGVPALGPGAFRRNVITEGLHLPDLAGARFTLGGIEV